MPHPCPICADLIVICAPRHVAGWGNLSVSEQRLLLARLGEAISKGVTTSEAGSAHGQFHFRSSSSNSGVQLSTGGAEPLLPLSAHAIDSATRVDLAVAFAMDSGVRLVKPWFRDLIARGGALGTFVGDYLDVTDPAALWRLSDSAGADIRVFETRSGSFHPRAWLFRAAEGRGSAIVGSSNLSATAPTNGVEWNLHSETAADIVEIAFQALWSQPQTFTLTSDWSADYTKRRTARPIPEIARRLAAEEPVLIPPEPHAIQKAALAALHLTRKRAKSRAWSYLQLVSARHGRLRSTAPRLTESFSWRIVAKY